VTEKIDDGDPRSVAGGRDGQAAPRCMRGEIRRPDHAFGALEVGPDLAAAEDVIAERDDVGARGEQEVGELRSDPDTVGHVLAVHNAEVDVELLA
jgi:hypothetical protein